MDLLPGSAFRRIIPVALAFLFVGGVGLALLVTLIEPTDATEGILYALLALIVAGLALPPIWYLNRRFNPPGDIAGWVRLLRQAGWVSLLVVIVAWMQASRVLNWLLIPPLAGMLLMLEGLFLTVTRANRVHVARPRSRRATGAGAGGQRE